MSKNEKISYYEAMAMLRYVKTVALHVGITIAHQVSTSLNIDRQGVEMISMPIGLYVIHKKTGSEFLVPYSNIHALEYLPRETPKDIAAA